MRHIFDIYPHIAIGSVVLASFFLIRSLIVFVLSRHTRHADRQRAVERLRNLARREQPVAQPVAGVPLPASEKVEASDETLSTKPFVSTETSPRASIELQPPAERLQRKPPVNQITFEREMPSKHRQTSSPKLPMPFGSKVWAICKLRSVNKGTPGIITGVAEARFFWQSPKYRCTFANNMSVLAGSKDIELYNHGHSIEDLKQPDLNSILSRRMTLRAQQLRYGQRSAHLPFAGPTKMSNEIVE